MRTEVELEKILEFMGRKDIFQMETFQDEGAQLPRHYLITKVRIEQSTQCCLDGRYRPVNIEKNI